MKVRTKEHLIKKKKQRGLQFNTHQSILTQLFNGNKKKIVVKNNNVNC